MSASRFIRFTLLGGLGLSAAACGPSQRERQLASIQADSISYLRDELLDRSMQATQFVNEINKALAKARSLTTPTTPLHTAAELEDVNEERNQVLSRVTLLVERLDAVQGRLAGLRRQISDKDSAFALKVAEYEQMVADAGHAAELQRVELQAIIDGQAAHIATLSGQVDTLSGSLGRLTVEHNAAYVVIGTRDELIRKGVLVAEGPRRYLVAGARPVVPARELDPSQFTRIDRMVDSTIFLPDGRFRIVSRQNPAYTAELAKDGTVRGAITIEDAERFWSPSPYLILLKS